MLLRTLMAGGVAVALASSTAWAASDADLEAIRAEIARMKQTYEARIAALEQRLAVAEAQATPTPAAQPPAASSAATGFNPQISAILSGTYASLSRDPEGYQITGFVPSGGEVGPPKRSFSIAESELVLSANIDPNWHGKLTVALDPDNAVSVEEAWIQSLALPHGFTLLGGRHFSGIGYINEQHAHAWDFVDAPLAQKAFLGKQYAQDGVQLKWLAPSDTFIELGAEAGRGANFPGSERNRNGVGAWSLFGHVGGDVGASHSWRAGVSYLSHRPQGREFESEDVKNTFTGHSNLWLADLVWKWAPEGNATQRNFKLQTEYYRRSERGTLTYDTESSNTPYGYDATQSGWYAQGVYQFMPRWRVGLRHDRLNYGKVNADAALLSSLPVLGQHNPTRNTLMLDYSASEFSRFRVQFARDESRKDQPDNQFMLQYVTSLGAHGAHKF